VGSADIGTLLSPVLFIDLLDQALQASRSQLARVGALDLLPSEHGVSSCVLDLIIYHLPFISSIPLGSASLSYILGIDNARRCRVKLVHRVMKSQIQAMSPLVPDLSRSFQRM
jgi:hypothetical protein